MQKVRFVGLDVHKASIAIALADADGSVPESVATVPNDTATLLKRLRSGAAAEERELLLDAIHHSINGIAAGLQTTG